MLSVPECAQSLAKEIIWIQSNDKTVTERGKIEELEKKESLCRIINYQ
jgi:hypothetical protein